MSFRGTIQGGGIVLEKPTDLPDGTEVDIQPVSVPGANEDPGEVDPSQERAASTLGQRLMELAGKAKGLPPDAALNHDHYLYGLPKK